MFFFQYREYLQSLFFLLFVNRDQMNGLIKMAILLENLWLKLKKNYKQVLRNFKFYQTFQKKKKKFCKKKIKRGDPFKKIKKFFFFFFLKSSKTFKK
jgi:hypothetical protein